MEIAVYGKGGIGKSTVSANLSAALAAAGHRVLQIGCDPKHDSTRLLTHGKAVRTVLDYLKDTMREEEQPSEVLAEGYLGVGCMEAGGPKPGVGCAGRGIISAFEFLDRHGVKEKFDTVLYDVLGDVVCGGFAVPVRREYADVIFLVTSGEFMSLYAANNILRGIRNFDGASHRRIAGIIYNERKLEGEDARVRTFADAVGLPVLVKVPRSHAFAEAEEKKMPLMELPGYEAEKRVFSALAAIVCPEMTLFEAKPLTDEDLESLFTGGAGSAKTAMQQKNTREVSQNEERTEGAGSAETFSKWDPYAEKNAARMPLYGCAFNGAATTAVHLTDAVVIAHGPRACAFYTMQNITSTGRKNLFNRGILMPSALSPHFESTDMGHAEAVFGGTERLLETVRAAINKKPGAVIVISSCVSGIIGDDIAQAEALSTPETPVIAIAADGVIAGDYMHGIRMCMDAVAERLIDPEVRPAGRLVNIINETGVSNNIALNYRVIESMLSAIGVSVNCRYLGDATADEMRHFLRAPLNILASVSQDSLERKAWLAEKYGCHFLDEPFPVGFEESARWLRKTAAFFGEEEKAETMIAAERERFGQEIEALRPALSGKTIVMTTINARLDWLLSAAMAAGMRFLWIGVLNYLHQDLNVSGNEDLAGVIEEEADWKTVRDKVRSLHPDLVLSNYTQTMEDGPYLTDSIPMSPQAGFHAAIPILTRWAGLFNAGKEGSWNGDAELFREYFS